MVPEVVAVNTDTIFVLATFAIVLIVIVFDWIDMTLAAMVGVSALGLKGIIAEDQIGHAINQGGGALALVFGCMIVARTLVPTGIFNFVADQFFILTRGSGRRFLLGLVLMVAPLCAVLPNATVVILLAPVVIRTSQLLEVDFVPPLILTAVVSNAAGLLTLVGDPATFIVGSSINLSFSAYMAKVSLAGVIAIGVVVPLLPILFRPIWRARRGIAADKVISPITNPIFVVLALTVVGIMVVLFIYGEDLPHPVGPPGAAILCASLALLVLRGARVEPVSAVFNDVDWKALLFIFCMFLMVEGMLKTGILNHLSVIMGDVFGDRPLLVAMTLLVVVAVASSMVANIPVVVAMVLIVKGYFVYIGSVPEEALGPIFTAWPAAALPVFIAMMFGATLGGNATVIGSSANVVTAGISARRGAPISFSRFLRYGLPITAAQLVVSAGYVVALAR